MRLVFDLGQLSFNVVQRRWSGNRHTRLDPSDNLRREASRMQAGRHPHLYV